MMMMMMMIVTLTIVRLCGGGLALRCVLNMTYFPPGCFGGLYAYVFKYLSVQTQSDTLTSLVLHKKRTKSRVFHKQTNVRNIVTIANFSFSHICSFLLYLQQPILVNMMTTVCDR